MSEPSEKSDDRLGVLMKLHRRMMDEQRPDRALRAQLRRCRTTDEALWIDGGGLWRDLGQPRGKPFDSAMTAAIALAHLKAGSLAATTAAGNLAALLGRSSEAGGRPLCSETRFRTLLQAETPTELLPPLLRALRLVDGVANPRDLARSILFWNEQTRRHWAFAYFQASGAEPSPASQIPASA